MITKGFVSNGMPILFTGRRRHILWITEKVVPSAVIAVRHICAHTCSLSKVAVVSSVAFAAVSPRVSNAPITLLSCWIHPNRHLMFWFLFFFPTSSASPLLPASGSHREEGGLLTTDQSSRWAVMSLRLLWTTVRYSIYSHHATTILRKCCANMYESAYFKYDLLTEQQVSLSRPPFIFLIDVSYNAVKNGMVGIVCQEAEDTVGLLAKVIVLTRRQCDQNNTAHSLIFVREIVLHMCNKTLHVQLWRCLCIVPAERTLMWNQTFELASSPTIKCFISIMWRPLSRPATDDGSVRCGWHVCAPTGWISGQCLRVQGGYWEVGLKNVTPLFKSLGL